MKEFSKYVGLDVHKETIAVAVAPARGGEVRFFGEIGNTAEAVAKLVRRISNGAGPISWCYEAGPCGYGIHRQLLDLGEHCQVVAPSLIPKKAGDRVKTDRRDALGLARLHRAGELTPVWVPDGAQEALRDLTRGREDMKHVQRQAKQRLSGVLVASWSALCGQVQMDPSACSMAGEAALRAAGATDRVSGVCRYGQRHDQCPES